LREQLKILSGEVALHKSFLKHLMEEAGRSTMNEHIEVISLSSLSVCCCTFYCCRKTKLYIYLKMEMKKVNEEIKGKQQQIENVERQIKGKLDQLEHPLVYYQQSISFKLLSCLN
jgi:centromeric protein E